MDNGALITAFAGIEHESAKAIGRARQFQQKCCPNHEAIASILCFSKARPFQLEQFIVSVESFVIGSHQLLVLYNCESFEREYEEVFSRHPAVVRVQEADEESFSEDLLHTLSTLESSTGAGGVICVCVDDLIVTAPVNLR